MHFFNRAKTRESEIDVLAHKRVQHTTKSGKLVDLTFRLAIEAKDSQLPFVLFGLSSLPHLDPEMVDPDSAYCHIATTRDRGMLNRFGRAALDDKLNPGWSKAEHHQLSAVPRLYLAATLEQSGNGTKLHVPAKLWNSLATLGAYCDYLESGWVVASQQHTIEAMLGGNLHVSLTFLMLVHRGPHYRYSVDTGELTESEISSVFLSLGAGDVQASFVVDFVAFDRLATGLADVEATGFALIRGLVGTIFASP